MDSTLAFWLNFIPNVGAVVAVLLPMPLVVLDPAISTAGMVLAFLLPFLVHSVVGNVLEPLVFGQSLDLHPVAILFTLMVWAMLWGITGMVLAVPITAVLKIHLSAVDHPAARFLVGLLDSKPPDAADSGGDDDEPPRLNVLSANNSFGGSGGGGVEGAIGHGLEQSAMEAATRPLVSSGAELRDHLRNGHGNGAVEAPVSS